MKSKVNRNSFAGASLLLCKEAFTLTAVKLCGCWCNIFGNNNKKISFVSYMFGFELKFIISTLTSVASCTLICKHPEWDGCVFVPKHLKLSWFNFTLDTWDCGTMSAVGLWHLKAGRANTLLSLHIMRCGKTPSTLRDSPESTDFCFPQWFCAKVISVDII